MLEKIQTRIAILVICLLAFLAGYHRGFSVHYLEFPSLDGVYPIEYLAGIIFVFIYLIFVIFGQLTWLSSIRILILVLTGIQIRMMFIFKWWSFNEEKPTSIMAKETLPVDALVILLLVMLFATEIIRLSATIMNRYRSERSGNLE